MRHFVCNVFILDVKCHLWHFKEVNTTRKFLAAKEQKHKDDDDDEEEYDNDDDDDDDEEDNNEIKNDKFKQSQYYCN